MRDDIDNIPFIAIGNGELENNENVGEFAKCNNCGGYHEVKYGDIVNKDGTKTPSKMLAFITCPENNASYLVGINGKLLSLNK